MRVVAGELGGRRLEVPPGSQVRPTLERVREAVFSVLGQVDGLRVLDLFAGSGALGIEAASRGAGEVVFVDSDPRAVAVVRRNLAALELEASVHRRDAFAFLAAVARRGDAPFDLVFVDPPYSSADRAAGRLSDLLSGAVTDEARIVTESDRRHPLELSLPLSFERIYGDSRIAIHHGA